MHTRKWLLPVTVLAILGASVGISNLAAEDDSELELQQRLRKLLVERVDIARQCAEASQASYEAGTLVLSDMLRSFGDWRDAELAVASTRAEEIKVLENHLDRVAQAARKIEALWNQGSKGGSAEEYGQARFERISAEIALLRARMAKTTTPDKPISK
jgi:hypothetical protein